MTVLSFCYDLANAVMEACEELVGATSPGGPSAEDAHPPGDVPALELNSSEEETNIASENRGHPSERRDSLHETLAAALGVRGIKLDGDDGAPLVAGKRRRGKTSTKAHEVLTFPTAAAAIERMPGYISPVSSTADIDHTFSTEDTKDYTFFREIDVFSEVPPAVDLDIHIFSARVPFDFTPPRDLMQGQTASWLSLDNEESGDEAAEDVQRRVASRKLPVDEDKDTQSSGRQAVDQPIAKDTTNAVACQIGENTPIPIHLRLAAVEVQLQRVTSGASGNEPLARAVADLTSALRQLDG